MNGRYDSCPTPVPRRPCILVVDDEPSIGTLLKTFLSADGYSVLLACDGPQALETLKSHDVSLVILDVRMPGMNGFEVCRRIRADPANARLPVIFLTADGANELAVFQGLEVGGDEYLTKPVHRRALSARVRNLLRLADVERERRLLRAVSQNEKLAAIGLIAAGIAHEVNNPMAFVLANLACLREYLEDLRTVIAGYREGPAQGAAAELAVSVDALFEDALPLLDETAEGCQRVKTTCTELKNFSRQDTERLEPVELSDVARSTLLLTERELAHVATVEKHLEPSAVDAGSRAKLQQVALNLLVNAKHAIEARPLPTGQRHAIRVATRTEGDSAVLEVSDTGCGIPPENVARLFEPFFTTKPVGIGSGLGLSVCATIVQRLGGRIDVESQIGVGTTFRVVIPCGASQSTSSTPCREAV